MSSTNSSRKPKHGIRRGFEARNELQQVWNVNHDPPPGFTYRSAVHALRLAFVEFWTGSKSDVLRLVCPILGSAIWVELPRASGGTMPFRVFMINEANGQIQSTPTVVARPRDRTDGEPGQASPQLLVLPFGLLVRRANHQSLSVTLLELPARPNFPFLSGVKVDFNTDAADIVQTVESDFRNGRYVRTRLTSKPGRIGIVSPRSDITTAAAPSPET